MLRRTTNFQYNAFGEISSKLPPQALSMSFQVLKLESKSFDRIFFSSDPIYIENLEGITMIAVSTDGRHFKKFVVHRIVSIDPHIYFNIVPITNTSVIKMYYNEASFNEKEITEPIAYKPIVSKIHIQEIFTNYYYIRKEKYVYPTQVIPFYLLMYVDQGEMELLLADQKKTIHKNECVLYYPNQKVAFHTTDQQSCSYLLISFSMESFYYESLKDQIIALNSNEVYSLLSKYMKMIQENSQFAHEFAMVYLKEVLLHLIQEQVEREKAEYDPMQAHYENALFNEILHYIQSQIDQSLSIEAICSRFHISRSKIQSLFNIKLGIGPKQYISSLKLDRAKEMIDEHKYTISEISERLGFTSIHYFSRKFKNHFGLTPTEYAKKR